MENNKKWTAHVVDCHAMFRQKAPAAPFASSKTQFLFVIIFYRLSYICITGSGGVLASAIANFSIPSSRGGAPLPLPVVR